jgi:hypothetical protein
VGQLGRVWAGNRQGGGPGGHVGMGRALLPLATALGPTPKGKQRPPVLTPCTPGKGLDIPRAGARGLARPHPPAPGCKTGFLDNSEVS